MKRLNNFVVAFAATLLVAGCAAPGSHQNVNVAGYQHADDNSSSALPKVVGCSDVPGMISDGGKTTHRLTPQLQVQLEAAGYVNKLEPDGRYHWVCGRSNNQVMPPQAAAVPSPAVKVAPTPLMPPPSAAVPPTNRAAAPKPLKEKGSCPDLCSTAKAEIKEISTEVKVLVRQVGEHGVRLKKQDDQLKTHTARLKEHD